MQEIKRSGYNITYYGQPNVGNFSQRWKLTGTENGFRFETKEDEEKFKELIADAFEYECGERVEVESFEEEIAREQGFDRTRSKFDMPFEVDY